MGLDGKNRVGGLRQRFDVDVGVAINLADPRSSGLAVNDQSLVGRCSGRKEVPETKRANTSERKIEECDECS